MIQLDMRLQQLRNYTEEEREFAIGKLNTELASTLLDAVKNATKIIKTVTDYGNIITKSYKVYSGEKTHITVENNDMDFVTIFYRHKQIFCERNNVFFVADIAKLKFMCDLLTLCERRSEEPMTENKTKTMQFFRKNVFAR